MPFLRVNRQHNGALALVLLILSVVACRVHTTSDLTAVCTGGNVAQRLVLSVDSVAPRAGPDMHALLGRRFPLTITLIGRPSAAECADRSGEASVEGDLPSALATELAQRHRPTPRWRVQGVDVVVELNPGVPDKSLSVMLPLDGSPGRWGYSTLAGQMVSGRAVRAR